MICPRCAAGEHHHERYPDGRTAECPYQGIPGNVDAPCTCPWRGDTTRGCSWCPAAAIGQTSSGAWACLEHWQAAEDRDAAVRRSARALALAQAECDAGDAHEAQQHQARMTAYEDALRGIAAAAVIARRTPHDLGALQTMLADTEHHLSSLIALGFIPPQGRPVTSSAPLDPHDPRALR